MTKATTAMGRIRNGSPSFSVEVDGRVSTIVAATGVIVAAARAVGAPLGATVAAAGAAVGTGDVVVAGVALGGAAVAGAVVAGAAVAAAAQVDRVIVSSMSVTVPFRARTRPLTVTPLASVIEVSASIVPAKLEPDPSLPRHFLTVHGVGYRFLP